MSGDKNNRNKTQNSNLKFCYQDENQRWDFIHYTNRCLEVKYQWNHSIGVRLNYKKSWRAQNFEVKISQPKSYFFLI